MKRTALCFLVICFLISTVSAWAETAKLIKLDAKLEILSGQVKLTRVGSAKTDIIAKDVELFAGDLLETLRESKAVLSYSDGTIMKIKPRTLIEVQPLSIKVFKGKTWYKFTKRGTEFRIETPTLVAGIRGTEFEVAVTSRKKASVSVMEGAVAVRSKAGKKSLLLRPGFATSCEPGEDLVAAYRFNLDKKNAEWNGAEWKNSADVSDINKLFINYLNLKYEYGDEDARTQEALKTLEAAKKKSQKK
ncbi:MAG: hypothetical protein Kow0029_22770 [Candidatus Rifleibacteriota bacterium]